MSAPMAEVQKWHRRNPFISAYPESPSGLRSVGRLSKFCWTSSPRLRTPTQIELTQRPDAPHRIDTCSLELRQHTLVRTQDEPSWATNRRRPTNIQRASLQRTGHPNGATSSRQKVGNDEFPKNSNAIPLRQTVSATIRELNFS